MSTRNTLIILTLTALLSLLLLLLRGAWYNFYQEGIPLNGKVEDYSELDYYIGTYKPNKSFISLPNSSCDSLYISNAYCYFSAYEHYNYLLFKDTLHSSLKLLELEIDNHCLNNIQAGFTIDTNFSVSSKEVINDKLIIYYWTDEYFSYDSLKLYLVDMDIDGRILSKTPYDSVTFVNAKYVP